MSQTALLYNRLRAAILSLALAPGATLTERGLESEFDASRTPIRAALTRLETEGLVVRAGRSYSVAPIDLDEIRAVGELRQALEVAAVRLAVERASDDDLAALRAHLETAHPADADEGVRAGGDFHAELASLAGNPFIADAVRGALARLERTRFLEARTGEARERSWREHRDVLAAVASRDAVAASALLEAHMTGTSERLLATLAGAKLVVVR